MAEGELTGEVKPITLTEQPTGGLYEGFVESVNQKLPIVGNLTRKDHIAGTDLDRPVPVRGERAMMTKELQTLKRTIALERKQRLKEWRAKKDGSEFPRFYETKLKEVSIKKSEFDDLARQFLENHHNVYVDFGNETGVQSSQVTFLEPPNAELKEKSMLLPPIHLIGGWGVDTDSRMSTAMEIARQGRRVVLHGYLDSLYGSMTDVFAENVKNAGGVGPHASYFEKSVETVQRHLEGTKGWPKDEKIELWGDSMGALIGATMLQNKEFGEKVANAVFYGPAGSVKQNKIMQAIGYFGEIFGLSRKWNKGFTRYSYVFNRKPDVEAQRPATQVSDGALWGKVWLPMLAKAGTYRSEYDTARVSDGGRITIIAPMRDRATDCAKRFNVHYKENPQIIVKNPDMAHQDFTVNPKEVIQLAFDARKEV